MKKLIILIFLLFSLVGCGDNIEQETEKIKLDWYINFSWYQEDFDDSLVARTIEDKFNVDINLISPTGDADKKLTSMINQNKLPDLLTLEWWNPQIKYLIEDEKVYSLTELNEETNFDFFDNTDQEVVDWNSINDQLYYYPNFHFLPIDYQTDNYQASNQCFLVRKDIYEEIGSPDMTTISGFRKTMELVKKKYPEISLIGAHEFTDAGNVSFDDYLMNFLAIPYLKDEIYYDRFTDQDYLDWLNFFRELYKDGYINDDIFTDKKIQMDEKVQNADYFCMLFQRTDIEYQQLHLIENKPDSIYIAVEGPKNSNQDDPLLPGTGINGWCDTMISKNCENPELALEIMTFLLSEEGQKLLFLGVEDITYSLENNNIVIKPEIIDLSNENRLSFNQIYGAKDTYWMLEQTRINLKWHQELDEPLKQPESWAYQYTVFPVNDIKKQDIEYYQIKENLDILWSDTLFNLLLAENKEEFDLIVEEYVEKRKELNYDFFSRIQTKEISENIKMLGLNYE
jgi:putative aldouronate transport system substrate-binding protein